MIHSSVLQYVGKHNNIEPKATVRDSPTFWRDLHNLKKDAQHDTAKFIEEDRYAEVADWCISALKSLLNNRGADLAQTVRAVVWELRTSELISSGGQSLVKRYCND